MITGLGHVAYGVSDLDKTLDFYCNKLGLKEIFSISHDDGRIWLLYVKVADRQFLEFFPVAEVAPTTAQSYMHLCLSVDNIHELVDELIKMGIEITSGGVNKGGDGNFQAWIKDPGGNPIELMQLMPDCMQLINDR